ncbi:hypothetical protein ACF1BQ_028835 [Bradyrhizobium sp. RDT10]
MFGARSAALFSARGVITLIALLVVDALIWFGALTLTCSVNIRSAR